MENNTTSNKFDNKIKDVLCNYQADFDANDWDKMESKLGALSTTKTINSKYIVYATLAIVFLTGTFFIINAIDWSNPEPAQTIVPETKMEKKTEQPIQKEKGSISVIADSAETLVIETTKEDRDSLEKENSIGIAEKKKERNEKEKTGSKNKEKNKTTNSEGETTNPEKVFTMGNEPIFGDMLDSSKGIIGRTKESAETKQAAKSKSDIPVGWNQFMLKNVNVDSLRNYRAKKDSIK